MGYLFRQREGHLDPSLNFHGVISNYLNLDPFLRGRSLPPNLSFIQYPMIVFQELRADHNTAVVFIKTKNFFSISFSTVIQLARQLDRAVIVGQEKVAVAAIAEQ